MAEGGTQIALRIPTSYPPGSLTAGPPAHNQTSTATIGGAALMGEHDGGALATQDAQGLRFKRRDTLVCAVCNFLLRHVASRDYRAMIAGSIQLGLAYAARLTEGERAPSGSQGSELSR